MPDTETAQARETILNWMKEARFFGEKDEDVTKRANPRYTWKRPMELLVDDRIFYVYSRDISEDGIGLTCRRRLGEGAQVRVRRDSNDSWVPARVAHCTDTVGAFKVGVELTFDF
jgi:hypothetical protein